MRANLLSIGAVDSHRRLASRYASLCAADERGPHCDLVRLLINRKHGHWALPAAQVAEVSHRGGRPLRSFTNFRLRVCQPIRATGRSFASTVPRCHQSLIKCREHGLSTSSGAGTRVAHIQEVNACTNARSASAGGIRSCSRTHGPATTAASASLSVDVS